MVMRSTEKGVLPAHKVCPRSVNELSFLWMFSPSLSSEWSLSALSVFSLCSLRVFSECSFGVFSGCSLGVLSDANL